MDNLVSCNLGSYRTAGDEALAHLAGLGVKWVELAAPAPDAAGAERDRLARFGLQAASLMISGNFLQAADLAVVEAAADSAVTMGASVLFASLQAGELPLDDAYARLRAAGDLLAARGLTLGMETHPDLCTNAAVMIRTMQAVDHPAVGINFDTANISYYTEHADVMAELEPVVGWVRSAHLKDTMGGFHEHAFPAVGQGVVDYPRFFGRLAAAGFHGPYTLEIEGFAGEHLDFAGHAQRVADSVDYLRAEGLMPR